jgi:hypothetical protein
MNLKASPEAIRIKAIGIFPLKKQGILDKRFYEFNCLHAFL